MSNNNNARYKESRELRNREIQMQTSGYILRFTALVPGFTQKDFHYVHQGPSTKGPPSKNYNNTNRSTQLQLSYTSTQ